MQDNYDMPQGQSSLRGRRPLLNMAEVPTEMIAEATGLLQRYNVPPEVAPVLAADVADWARHHVYQGGLIGKLSFVFRQKVKQICDNLDPGSHVNGGSCHRVDPVSLQEGRYEPEDLRPDIWQPHIEEYEKKEELVWTRECETVDTEECERCGKREAWIYTMQLRSLDEGTTMRVICKPCGYAWTHNN
jgi:hypothetical protein